MKKLRQYIFIPAILASNLCFAQTPKIKQALNPVTIDGNITEWANFVFDTDKKANIDYLITKDDNNIYLAIKTTDPVKIGNILGSGLTWTINTDGKKSNQYSIRFPMVEKKDKENQEGYLNLIPEQIVAKTALIKQRYLSVKGFKDIKDNEISPLNPYDIKVAIDYNENSGLAYEAAIPLVLLKVKEGKSTDWAFNIKINGLEKVVRPTMVIVSRSNSTNNPNPGSPPPPETGDIQLTPSVDFWSKFSVN